MKGNSLANYFKIILLHECIRAEYNFNFSERKKKQQPNSIQTHKKPKRKQNKKTNEQEYKSLTFIQKGTSDRTCSHMLTGQRPFFLLPVLILIRNIYCFGK